MIVADSAASRCRDAQVRNDLRALDARFRVIKNTLGRIAAERADVADVAPCSTGPIAVAFCRADPAPVAKRLNDFARKTRMLELRGGLVDGRVARRRRRRARSPRCRRASMLIAQLSAASTRRSRRS